MLKPWAPGQSGNPLGRQGASEYQATINLAREHSRDAMRKLIAKMDSRDERVALVAQQAVLERAWGKPKEFDPSVEKPELRIDLRGMSLEDRKMLLALMDRVTMVPVMPTPDSAPTAADDGPPTIDVTQTTRE